MPVKYQDFSYSSLAKLSTKPHQATKNKPVISEKVEKISLWVKLSSFFAAFFSIIYHVLFRLLKKLFLLFESSIFSGLSKSRKYPIERMNYGSINSFLTKLSKEVDIENGLNLPLIFNSNLETLDKVLYSNKDFIEKKLTYLISNLIRDFYKSEYLFQLIDEAKSQHLMEHPVRITISEFYKDKLPYLNIEIATYTFNYSEGLLQDFIKGLEDYSFLKIEVIHEFDLELKFLRIEISIPDLKYISRNNILNFVSAKIAFLRGSMINILNLIKGKL